MPVHRIDALDIHFVHRGPEDSPRRVLYVHGTGCNARVWDRHCASLPPEYQTACIDLAGHGRSSGAGFRGTADHAFVIDALADRLGWDRFVLVGHSLGGAIALTHAVYHPARLDALVLVDTGGRLRVAPEVLENARLAALGQEIPAPDPRWTYSPRTPDSVIEQVWRTLARFRANSSTGTGSRTTRSTSCRGWVPCARRVSPCAVPTTRSRPCATTSSSGSRCRPANSRSSTIADTGRSTNSRRRLIGS